MATIETIAVEYGKDVAEVADRVGAPVGSENTELDAETEATYRDILDHDTDTTDDD